MWPFSRLRTYVASSTPSIKAADLNAMQDAIVALFTFAGVFGDGSDGNLILDATNPATGMTRASNVYRMDRDIYANDLTMSSTAVLWTNGFRLFVRGTLTIPAANIITNFGFNAVGTTHGAGASEGSVGGGEAGGDGGAGSSNGTAGNLTTQSLGGSGGDGGDGFDSGTNTGGAGGTATAPAAARGGYKNLVTMQTGTIMGLVASASVTTALKGGAGGGGAGGATSGGDQSNGGGGGGGGGVVLICAAYVSHDGSIEAKGGNGGDAVTIAGAGDSAGGGGGGGGGLILLFDGQRTGSGTFSVDGGDGGAPDSAGEAGDPGAVGTVLELGLL
jgi:hypothetical protein